MLVVFSLTTGEFVVAGILPEVAGALLVPVSAAGQLVTAYALGMIVGGPVVTVATARLPRRAVLLGLVAVAVLANLGSALAPGYSVLLATRFAAGLVVATFFAVAVTTAVALAPAGKAASTIAQIALGMNLGLILGTPLGTWIGQQLGWRATFAVVAACALAALGAVLLFVTELPSATAGSALRELRVLGDRRVLLAIALTALGNVGVLMVFTYITPLLTEVAGFAAAAAPVLLLVYGAGAVVGNQLGGRAADRALLPALTGLLTCLSAALAIFGIVDGNHWLAVLLVFVLGVLAFAIIPGMQARVITAAAAAPTLAVAINASGFQLAAALAGRSGGWIIGAGPGPRALPLIGAAVTLAAAGLAGLMLYRDSRSPRVGAATRP
ncbi:MFS transporter [Nocardia sp. NPDC127526]|uniref:MFS transporter n=1 Tax=Nocardia sp. NPDC127526 TaxID=3345393 RepID=UPI0036412399